MAKHDCILTKIPQKLSTQLEGRHKRSTASPAICGIKPQFRIYKWGGKSEWRENLRGWALHGTCLSDWGEVGVSVLGWSGELWPDRSGKLLLGTSEISPILHFFKVYNLLVT